MSTLLLAPEPQSVRRARAWVVEELSDLGREDLVDSAELGVSELVTNAILHAHPPITVRLGGTPQHPRVEVHDRSPRPPAVNTGMAEDSQLLRTVGRGLGIVALYSSNWGADVSPDGKVVWFEPALEPADSIVADLPPGLAEDLAELGLDLEGDDELASMLAAPGDAVPPMSELEMRGDVFDLTEEVQRRLSAAGEPVELLSVRLLGMPVQVFAVFRQWYAEIRRELRLLAFAHPEDYPVAAELAEITLQVEQERAQASGVEALDAAIAAGVEVVDLDYRVPVTAPETMARIADVLDRVDVFCREQLLLTMPEPRQVAEVRRWYFGEFARQARGLEPSPWQGRTRLEDDPQA